MNLIVVDDDSVCLMRLRLTLDALGHDCRFFDTGLDAWEAHCAKPADVIISDWQMPHFDGVDLCRRVRQQPDVPYTYFILVTAAYTADADYTTAIAADVDDFLTKPLRRDAIWRRLHVARRIRKFTTQIQQLELLLPICVHCKKIREGEQDEHHCWQQMEQYIHDRTGSEFSHGVCPECMEKVSAQWGVENSSFQAA